MAAAATARATAATSTRRALWGSSGGRRGSRPLMSGQSSGGISSSRTFRRSAFLAIAILQQAAEPAPSLAHVHTDSGLADPHDACDLAGREVRIVVQDD